ncbi:MAG: SDR family NAD(P)-dependent oxidoreductase [Phycisphaerae bacterium]
MKLKDKVVIITGAAGSIGRAAVDLFVSQGAILSIVDIDENLLKVLADKIQKAGGKVLNFSVDVSSEPQVKSVIQTTLKTFGKIDIVVNGAGICRMIPIADIQVEEWDHMMAVNLRSVFLFCREVFPHMKSRGYGKIINIASAAGKIGGLAAGAHYSASKAGVICFTKSLALQAAPYKINVNAVCPGPTKSEMTEAWGEKTNKDFAAIIPFKEYAEPIDIAEAILFLASDRAKYITGEILDVNGGLVMD